MKVDSKRKLIREPKAIKGASKYLLRDFTHDNSRISQVESNSANWLSKFSNHYLINSENWLKDQQLRFLGSDLFKNLSNRQLLGLVKSGSSSSLLKSTDLANRVRLKPIGFSAVEALNISPEAISGEDLLVNKILANKPAILLEIENFLTDLKAIPIPGKQRVTRESAVEAEADQETNRHTLELIQQIRRKIKAIKPRDMELVPRREIFAESAVQRIKGIYYKQLNKLSPYYTQIANIGILESKKTKAAWRQTCNVTSLAMTLAGLGIGPTDFRGNQDLLLHIAQNLDPEDFQRYGDLSAARFPDFLQFVVIYVKYVQKHGDGTPALTVPPGEKKNVRLQKNRVIQARGRALGVIADNLKWFNQIAILFGANATPRNYVASRGSTKLERRKFSKKWIEIYEAWKFYSQLVNKKKLEIRKLSKRLANKKLEKSERERLVTEINLLEQELTLTKAKQKKEERETRLKNQVDDYMIWAYLNVLPLLEEGKQVVVNRKGHYVRLQDITDAHILVDDPFQPGKDVEIPWKLAYQRMFFRSFVVVAKD